ncbi:GDSL esterase/lipase [Arachis hypogaea]|nr:GDSL esterase/lipase [Arachis hypogaea]
MKLNNLALVVVLARIILGNGIIRGCECKTVQFIFGDSLSDVGNNKSLNRSLAQASLPWYGIDFGNGLSNGRFTNGRTVANIIGDNTGLPRPPAFLDPSSTPEIILENGANYAYSGGGILNETGQYFVSSNVKLHSYCYTEARYVVALGSNDFINNYLMPVYSDSWTYNDDTFMDYLIGTLRDQLRVYFIN